MTVRPILFSGSMVQALLANEKTQTRRTVNPQPTGAGSSSSVDKEACQLHHEFLYGERRCPYGNPGDLLWVRESFSYLDTGSISPKGIWCWADGNPEYGDWSRPKPSIHMPRWASRLTLELTAVRTERLQSISEMDAYAEGIDTEGNAYLAAEHGKLGGTNGPSPSVCAYADLWDSINGPGSWDANPWVWVLTFNAHQCNVDAYLKGEAA